jgi:hypothetical protein
VKRTRMKAQDFMWNDGAAVVCGLGHQVEQTPMQAELSGLLDEIAQDRSVPLDAVEKLGRVVRLAYDIGRAR